MRHRPPISIVLPTLCCSVSSLRYIAFSVLVLFFSLHSPPPVLFLCRFVGRASGPSFSRFFLLFQVFDDPPCSCENGICTTCAGFINAGTKDENYKLAVDALGAEQKEKVCVCLQSACARGDRPAADGTGAVHTAACCSVRSRILQVN